MSIETLKYNSDFRRLYNKGSQSVDSLLAVYCRRNGRGFNRLGITTGAKLGNAVVRNRARRLCREAYRLSAGRMAQGYDIVIAPRFRAVGAGYSDVERSWIKHAGKLNLLRRDRPPGAGDGGAPFGARPQDDGK